MNSYGEKIINLRYFTASLLKNPRRSFSFKSEMYFQQFSESNWFCKFLLISWQSIFRWDQESSTLDFSQFFSFWKMLRKLGLFLSVRLNAEINGSPSAECERFRILSNTQFLRGSMHNKICVFVGICFIFSFEFELETSWRPSYSGL